METVEVVYDFAIKHGYHPIKAVLARKVQSVRQNLHQLFLLGEVPFEQAGVRYCC
jgi:hypothetical protein